MAKVYYAKKIEPILDQIDYSTIGHKVAIKVHFGEKGCLTFIDPEIVKKVYDKIINLGKEATLVECNVLYKGSRTNRIDHLKTAREHGFLEPIEILDGANGQDFILINNCKIGQGIKNYDSLFVLTHFKGHIAAGFGGAIKNIAMGLGSRAGKLYMHSDLKPSVSDDCIGCGICIENCPAKAISMIDGKAAIDNDKCEGCAMCIAVCNNGAVQIPWSGGTSESLQRKMAEYAAAVLSIFSHAIFINVLENITVNCDCRGEKQQPMMPDVGIIYSDDIVAIDQASLDLANKYSAGNFAKINMVDKDKQIELAEKLKLGSKNYELVELK